MGLGPSIKMTTLHHFNCPTTRLLLRDRDVDFAGVIVSGVSENYDDKVSVAEETGKLAFKLGLDGALVAIDGWGNHHVDFVSVIEQLGKRGIRSVGLSFIGQQGRLVCSNEYISQVLDFNKSPDGYETCVVGQNNLTDFDSYKALGLLKAKISAAASHDELPQSCITRQYLHVEDIHMTVGRTETRFDVRNRILVVSASLGQEKISELKRLKKVKISIIEPGHTHQFVNSNLDFMPIAKKESGTLGNGSTCVLSGITVMLTGVEDGSGYQPANIGSSEGYLDEVVAFDRSGTPKRSDVILHIDCLFREGEGRTAEGIAEAHMAADYILNEIRDCIPARFDGVHTALDSFRQEPRQGKPRVGLIKLVSGLGTMYDTSLFPSQPGGYLGSDLIRAHGNMPVFLTPAQVLDGAIHSLT